ncbi:hypothetical protein G7Y89_g12814 [Cudoniella acicularis]|uniref:Uncharacterized protein n=1 Tax=Cudoniella acicularis TaxID=354080 RepID=A0A8H4RAI2_9HELO|nr:hypothetical protein G7Y89_g12814 [Cudoniella acicularis]
MPFDAKFQLYNSLNVVALETKDPNDFDEAMEITPEYIVFNRTLCQKYKYFTNGNIKEDTLKTVNRLARHVDVESPCGFPRLHRYYRSTQSTLPWHHR